MSKHVNVVKIEIVSCHNSGRWISMSKHFNVVKIEILSCHNSGRWISMSKHINVVTKIEILFCTAGQP